MRVAVGTKERGRAEPILYKLDLWKPGEDGDADTGLQLPSCTPDASVHQTRVHAQLLRQSDVGHPVWGTLLS